MLNKLHLIGLIFLFISCNFSPEPINYGVDECNYCKMIIVDNAHSSEIFTNKGKSYKFDSIECMVNYLHENHDTDYVQKPDKTLILVSNFNSPGSMLNVTNAKFLISEKISSPMGANLSAFTSIKEILEIDNNAQILDWNTLVENFRNLIQN
ncbi:MAG: hypothetical protein HOC22_00950 [Cryomorphaceae bacterium]|jgi:copper chaperone NosL|nr:hypothetical protein [Cryomorphaceae bacterium]MBT3503221.1 hypothetical protein [Cryomorphaceae bacterium]MBT3688757.1 hypothetical protein [Cryomorphaceae bacterium]MBT4222369.1 hypothetical protein [Cryomorphaceae bacterium]MBT4517236.1 hypothetical protein [Cryomorphaceae bacterium]